MRTVGSALLVILGLLLAAVAGPALWLERNVVDGAGFAQLAGPLGTNSEFQEGLSALAADQATASMNLPPQLNELAGALINSAARSIYTNPGYEVAWTQTLQRSHKLTFDAAGNQDVQGDLKLDIAPLVELVAAKVTADLGVPLPTPKEVVVSLEQPQVAKVLPLASALGGASGWMAFIAVDLLALGVIVAKRRALSLILGGAGLAAVALLWQLGSGFAESALAGLAVGPEVAQQFGVQLGALARASWQGGITATFVIAGVMAAAGVVALIVRGRRTT
ncbi:hypothetical protein AS189_06065 [Arthrobacter alpinus]|uniref:Uncharacterized protein n=1 Tax=Arthrobacter alpinus TaxID=656366 RepID=A0A0S2LY68_9MICC|nr:hypothetical protein [Arthrobacter alpinus]ALO66139.1 hypothetical protein AS189_06065 [Arthrobacter alpinus]